MDKLTKTPSLFSLTAASMITCLATTTAQAQIGSSGDDGQTSATTSHLSSVNTFNIDADVDLDPGFGPWKMQLTNEENKFSGSRVQMIQTINNIGSESWTSWVESVLTVNTGGGGGGDTPGFLFDSGTISVQADYGSGWVSLTEGIDYTLTGTVPFNGTPGQNNNGHYSQVLIEFAAGFEINNGDTLLIDKEIFEVFNDSDTWQTTDIAEIAAYPVPEPTSLALLALGGLGLLSRRKRH